MEGLRRFRRFPLGHLHASRGVHYHKWDPSKPKPVDLEEPPTKDEIIKVHYLKHHPMYEFRNMKELSIDPYRYWNHARIDAYNSPTYTIEEAGVHPWEDSSKFWNIFMLLYPFLATAILTKEYKRHCLEAKNDPNYVIGVFSQNNVSN